MPDGLRGRRGRPRDGPEPTGYSNRPQESHACFAAKTSPEPPRHFEATHVDDRDAPGVLQLDIVQMKCLGILDRQHAGSTALIPSTGKRRTAGPKTRRFNARVGRNAGRGSRTLRFGNTNVLRLARNLKWRRLPGDCTVGRICYRLQSQRCISAACRAGRIESDTSDCRRQRRQRTTTGSTCAAGVVGGGRQHTGYVVWNNHDGR